MSTPDDYAKLLTKRQAQVLAAVPETFPFHLEAHASLSLWYAIRPCWNRYLYKGMGRLTKFGREVKEALKRGSDES